jgi:hypothetical protein
MLKRDNKFGEPHTVPGSTAQLTDNQMEAYNAAFRAIEHELLDVKKVREELNRLEQVNLDKPVPKAFATITTPEGDWKAHAQLLKLFRSEVLLGRQGENEWAVIQKFQPRSIYAQAHGETDILLKGNDVREVMTEYMAQVRHTLRFMARNLAAKAQQVVWEHFPDDNPSLVVRALSERCSHVAENNQAVKQSQTETMRQSRGIGI